MRALLAHDTVVQLAEGVLSFPSIRKVLSQNRQDKVDIHHLQGTARISFNHCCQLQGYCKQTQQPPIFRLCSTIQDLLKRSMTATDYPLLVEANRIRRQCYSATHTVVYKG